jgi:hypothetical protein
MPGRRKEFAVGRSGAAVVEKITIAVNEKMTAKEMQQAAVKRPSLRKGDSWRREI